MNESPPQNQTLFSLSLAALGIVYGDIGTSPLYAIRESLEGLPINLIDVLGRVFKVFQRVKNLVKRLHSKNGVTGCPDLSLMILCGVN